MILRPDTRLSQGERGRTRPVVPLCRSVRNGAVLFPDNHLARPDLSSLFLPEFPLYSRHDAMLVRFISSRQRLQSTSGTNYFGQGLKQIVKARRFFQQGVYVA